jgi:hypothetical protein
MFFVELKPTLNNKDIFNVEYIQQCKIKFEPHKHKRDVAQCASCGHTKNYWHLKPRCVKCAGDHSPLEKPMPLIDVFSVVENILRTTRNVRSTRTYKIKHTQLSVGNNTLLLHKSNLTHSTGSNTFSNNKPRFLCCHKYRAKSTHKQTSSANQQYTKKERIPERQNQ